ncbi:MAG: hypothetical protein J5719_00805, partial [Bacteroidales bacterium]|nr:hypothetical protein [Bacteroidales bacterium]
NCLPYFIQNNNGTGIQRYYESGCQRYGYFIRCVKEPEAQLGMVQTKAATDVKWNAATLNGYIVSDGYTSVTERGFFWNTTGAPTSEDNKVIADGSSYTYSYNMTDLTPETKYYVKAYMINTEGMSLGEDVEFTTLPKPAVATVTTGEAYNIMLTSVSIDGEVTADGGAEVTERGICYATTAEPTIDATVVKSGKGLGSFTAELTGLASGTAYFARAYAVNEIGVAYGNEVKFSPLAEASKPTVLTKSVTNVLDVSATVHGEITANGGDDVTASGVCYSSENKMPEITDQVQTATATMGAFSVNLAGLTPDKTYYVRAYAQNAAGVAYGDTISFTTLSEILEMRVDAGEVTGVTRTDATVSATLKYGVDVAERGFIYGLYKNITHKSHPTVVLLGSQVVEGTDNGEFSYTFTNFIQGGMYYVRGYAKTSTGEYAYSPDMKVVMQDPDGLKDCGTVTDPDGNVYRTVQLGGQCWMRENLHTTKYSDGSDISLFLPGGTTKKVSQTITEYVPSVVTYSGYGDTLTGDNAGYFYGYGLRSDPKANMLCPSGWHVSSGEDWNNLFNYVNETYCEGSLTLKPYASNTKTIQVVNNQNLYYPLVLPHYFGSNGFKNTNENTNATGFGWFYFGDLNGNTSSSYYRTSQTYYEAMWTSSPVTTTTTATMNSFVQHNATYMQYVNETGNVGYGMMLRCVKD